MDDLSHLVDSEDDEKSSSEKGKLHEKVGPTCYLKRDHLKRTFHLPTINFQGICWFSGVYSIETY